MSSFLPKPAYSARVLLTSTFAALCLMLQATAGHAQTSTPEVAANPNEVLVFEQMRVPRWLAETVVRAAQATNVDPRPI